MFNPFKWIKKMLPSSPEEWKTFVQNGAFELGSELAAAALFVKRDGQTTVNPKLVRTTLGPRRAKTKKDEAIYAEVLATLKVAKQRKWLHFIQWLQINDDQQSDIILWVVAQTEDDEGNRRKHMDRATAVLSIACEMRFEEMRMLLDYSNVYLNNPDDYPHRKRQRALEQATAAVNNFLDDGEAVITEAEDRAQDSFLFKFFPR